MPIYRVGVQATNSSAGQGVDFDGGSFASDLSLVNVSGESVAYSTNGGTAWTTVSAGASASIGSIAQDQFRLRRVASGAYPLPVDVDVTAVSALTPPEVFAIQALVSGDGTFDALPPALPTDVVLPFALAAGVVTPLSEQRLTLAGGPARLAQVATKQSTLPIRTVLVSATSTIALGACAIAGIQAITLGTGTLSVYDSIATVAAARLRFERGVGAMVAGTYYPMVADEAAAMLFDQGAYLTVPTGGLYAVDLIDERNLSNVDAAGLLCLPTRVSATGVVFYGGASVVSIKVIAPGSAGNLIVYDNVNTSDALRLRFPSTAFGSLTADQTIRFGARGCAASFPAMHITVPTGGIVLVNTLPR